MAVAQNVPAPAMKNFYDCKMPEQTISTVRWNSDECYEYIIETLGEQEQLPRQYDIKHGELCSHTTFSFLRRSIEMQDISEDISFSLPALQCKTCQIRGTDRNSELGECYHGSSGSQKRKG